MPSLDEVCSRPFANDRLYCDSSVQASEAQSKRHANQPCSDAHRENPLLTPVGDIASGR